MGMTMAMVRAMGTRARPFEAIGDPSPEKVPRLQSGGRNPEHEPEFRHEHKDKCNATHSKSSRRHTGHRKMYKCPPSRHNCDYEHEWHLHQFGNPRAETRDGPQRADRSKQEPRSEHKCEVKYTSLHHLHHKVPPSLADDDRARFSQHHSAINSLTTNSVPKTVLLWLASQFGR